MNHFVYIYTRIYSFVGTWCTFRISIFRLLVFAVVGHGSAMMLSRFLAILIPPRIISFSVLIAMAAVGWLKQMAAFNIHGNMR